MAFANSKGHNLYWLDARTIKQLDAWCKENGISIPNRSRKSVYLEAVKQAMRDGGIDIKTHPDYRRATSSSSGCFTHGCTC